MLRILHTILATALLMAAQSALAERVYVKARGDVDLAPFRCGNFPRSANVKRVCYDEQEAYVLVSLKCIWYHFCGVPPSAVSAWRKASSPGRYYNDYVREKYECHATEAPTYR
jgi:KTSC domain